jgi:glycosyltransferase involved in cell wall biosynthesis
LSGYADGSADDLVIDGLNGFRLRQGTAAELAQRIGQILDDPAMAAKMGKSSRELITGRFGFERFVDRVVAALEKLA